MSDARRVSYNFEDECDDFDEELEQSITNLQNVCFAYYTNYFMFRNDQDLQAKYVISQFRDLLNCTQNIPEGHRVAFKKVMLYSYIIALSDYLPSQSKLAPIVNTLRNNLSTDPAYENTKSEYKAEINQIKTHFSNQCKNKDGESFSGFAALYDAYDKKNNNPGLINLDTIPTDEEIGENCTRLKPMRRKN